MTALRLLAVGVAIGLVLVVAVQACGPESGYVHRWRSMGEILRDDYMDAVIGSVCMLAAWVARR